MSSSCIPLHRYHDHHTSPVPTSWKLNCLSSMDILHHLAPIPDGPAPTIRALTSQQVLGQPNAPAAQVSTAAGGENGATGDAFAKGLDRSSHQVRPAGDGYVLRPSHKI